MTEPVSPSRIDQPAPVTLDEVEVFLCRATGEGSHNFRICTTEEQVFLFYDEMFGKDSDGKLDSAIAHFRDPDNWSNSGTAYECKLYCATFEVWKVDDRELSSLVQNERDELERLRSAPYSWARANACTPSESGNEAKLTEPALVGNTRFGVGVSERMVIERAQREYKYQVTPEKEAARMERVRSFVQTVGNIVNADTPVEHDPIRGDKTDAEPYVGQSGGNWAVWLCPNARFYVWSFDGPYAERSAHALAASLKRALLDFAT